MNKKYSNLFDPIKIGDLEIKNRFVMAPMGPAGLCSEDGSFNEKGIEYYVERAKGGTGLIITGVTYVENDIEKCAMPSMPCPTINPSSFIKAAKVLTERVHAYNSKIFLQLTAGFGRVSIPGIVGDITPIAPSPIPHKWIPDITCRPLTIEEIEIYIKKFGESAAIAKEAGFDGVEVHAVHEGYLLDQFTMTLFNKRTDKYGGSLENRLRFPIEILKEIKEQCGVNFPVSLRYSVKSYVKGLNDGALPGEDFEEKGRDLAEGLEAAKILEKAGYDAFNSDAGTYDSWYWNHPPMYFKKGMYLSLNEKLKQVLKVPVITAGRMDNPDLASDAISTNKTDMIALGRPLLADAYIPEKIRQDKLKNIRPCLSCHDGCMGRLALGGGLSCAVNPSTGREKEFKLEPATEIKNVLVIGGGVAGCEAARVCAIRGHKVSLYEKTDKLGGNIIPGGTPDFKEDDRALVKWYYNELKENKVDIHFNTTVTEELANNPNYDVVIVATGSNPKLLQLNGNMDKVYTAQDVLLKSEDAGNSSVIIGGGLVGCETALWLVQQGKNVTLIEALDEILASGPAICHANSQMLKDLLKFHKVDIKTNCLVSKVTDEGIVIKQNDKEIPISCDSVILSVGYTSEKDLYEKLKFTNKEMYLLGDAKQVQNIMTAIWDAYEVARNI
ncbi:oxidoreductase [Clostridium botulinum]|uniref:oxidoreductase n=1 Tax=Clostridium botulinum TaxID=1491 RepID=UPI0004DA2DA9|nr:FAD-dependent oxidoreductase [Clostridium botulinum]KEI01248.1 2-enoate reductase [Clostridium botulinum D str. 16868]